MATAARGFAAVGLGRGRSFPTGRRIRDGLSVSCNGNADGFPNVYRSRRTSSLLFPGGSWRRKFWISVQAEFD
jgi:hypothetical protein